MMPRFECIIRGCSSNSSSRRTVDASFFPVPSLNDFNEDYLDLSTRRRLGWIISINRTEITWENCGDLGILVCSRHFISGRPALLKDETNPDWIPSLNLKLSSAGDEMLKYRLSQIAPPYKDRRKRGRPTKAWTVKKRRKSRLSTSSFDRKRTYLPFDQYTPIACRADSTTDTVIVSDSSHCSSTEDDYNEESQNSFEIPTLNNHIRSQLFAVLHAYQPRCSYDVVKNKPLAVLTTSISKDKDNFITWNCKDMISGRLWFASTTALEKMKMSKEMLNENVYGYSLYARAECERNFLKLLKNMERHKCPYLEITCNSVKAVLHLDKFHCPGATRRCVEYNGTLVTPIELMRATCPFNPKDWKFHFKVHNNGSILGFLFDSAKFDFTDHEKFCTQFCLPSKQALLIELDLRNNTVGEKLLPNKCCLPFCRNHTPKSRQEQVTYHSLPAEKERCELWLEHMGVLEDVMGQDFAKIQEANLKLCSDHFDDEQFFFRIHSRVRHLRRQAVPTVFEFEKEISCDTITLNSTCDEKQMPDSDSEKPFVLPGGSISKLRKMKTSTN